MMSKKLWYFTAKSCVVLLLLALTGCASKGYEPKPIPFAMPVDPPPGADMLTANTYAGDALASMLLRRAGPGKGILVTSFVNMENIETSSAFGRMSMQQVSSRVAQHGFTVLEVRLANALTMDRKQGELMLTRDSAKLLEANHDAHAVLVGVYSRTADKIFISARVIRLADTAVIASYEYYLPLIGDVRYLLQSSHAISGGGGGTWQHYASRGKAFAAPEAAPSQQPRTTGSVERLPATTGGTSHPIYTPPSTPEYVNKAGGRVIDPAAQPAPLRSGKKK